MPEELQELLNRIQKEGVEKAEAHALLVVEKARADAVSIREKAVADAGSLVAIAEHDAKAFEDRARRALRQAARDLVLSVGESIQATLENLVAAEVEKTLDTRVLGEVLQTLISGYFSSQAGGVQILLPEERQKEVADYLLARFKQELGTGIEIRGERSTVSGFKVRQLNGNIVHDLSAPAIAESLSSLLRPHLSDIVRKSLVQPNDEASGRAPE